jgi:26S proteasome regulatory subunit T5
LDLPDEDEIEDGAAFDTAVSRHGKCAVIKTSMRQTIFLPVIGLVPVAQLKPSDLIGVNKDSFLILDMLPAEYVAVVFVFACDLDSSRCGSDMTLVSRPWKLTSARRMTSTALVGLISK